MEREFNPNTRKSRKPDTPIVWPYHKLNSLLLITLLIISLLLPGMSSPVQAALTTATDLAYGSITIVVNDSVAGGFTNEGGPALTARLLGPDGIAFDRDGNLFIADKSNNRIREVAATDHTQYGINMAALNIYTIAGTGQKATYTSDGGRAIDTKTYLPSDIIFDNDGNLYGTDVYHVFKIDSSGIITTIAGNGTLGYSGDGGLATSAKIKASYIALDKSGNLYISQTSDNCVRRVDTASGIITTVVGPATGASLNKPYHITVDSNDNLYIADSGNNCIRRVDKTTGVITTIAGTGVAGNSGDGGLATAASLNTPCCCAFDKDGNLYIGSTGGADYGYVRKIDHQSGIITTAVDGSANNIKPKCMAFDSDGNLYITNGYLPQVFYVQMAQPAALTTLTLSGNPALSYGGSPVSFDLSTLTLAGADQYGDAFDLSGQSVSWAVYSDSGTSAVIDGSTLTASAAGTVGVTAAVYEVVSNVLDLTIISTVNNTDTTLPEWPPNSTLEASSVGQTGLTLTWSDASDNVGVVGYAVYQENTLLTPALVNGNTYNVTGLSAGTSYSFNVQAADAAGNLSTGGPSVSATTAAAEWVPLALGSASTDHIGKKVILEFNKEMADPGGKESEFVVKVDGVRDLVTIASLGDDPKQILLDLTNRTTNYSSLTFTYTDGTIVAIDGTALENISNMGITNLTLTSDNGVMLRDFAPTATELARGGDGTFNFRFDNLMDYDNVKLALYFYSGFFNNFTDNLANYVRFYEKNTGQTVALPNVVTVPHTFDYGYGYDGYGYMEVTDWYFVQASGRSPLGLNLKTTALKPNTTYVVEVLSGFAFNNGNTAGGPYKFEFTTTAESAAKPYWADGSSLSASELTDTGLTLSWPAVSDNHGTDYDNLHYNLYQNDTLLATLEGMATSYQVTGLSPETNYQFRLEAIDFAGNHSLSDLQTTAQTTEQVLAVPITTPTVAIDESGSNRKQAVTAGTPDFELTVPASVTNAIVDVSSLVSTSGDTTTTSALPAMDIDAATSISNSPVVVSVPAGTAISAAASSNWHGTINVPTVKSSSSVTVPASSGYSATVGTVIEVGFGDVPLNLSQAVRILIPGQAGKEVGYVRNGIFTKITNVLAADTQAAGDALAAGGEGKIDVGNDLVVWTKHFTSFVTYTETVDSSTDTTPPNWSSGILTASNLTSSGLTLNWPPATDDVAVTGYKIYQNGSVIADVSSAMLAYPVTGLTPGTLYAFIVQAGDDAGNWSTNGLSAQATTLTNGSGSTDTQAPAFRTGAVLSVQMTGNQQANVTWPEATDNVGVTGYKIFRINNETGVSVQLNAVAGTTNMYTDPNSLPSGTTAGQYTWKVQAYDAAGNLSAAITGSPATGQNPLDFVASNSYLVTVSGNSATTIALIQGNTSVPVNPTIMLYFDRGVTNESVWNNNKHCITMQDSSRTDVPINVFWLENQPGTTYVHDIFLNPTSSLSAGHTYKIIISKNLTANNGKTLGENDGNQDQFVTFTVTESSTITTNVTVVTTNGPTSTNGTASVDPTVGATVGQGSNALVVIPANALTGTASITVTVQQVASPPAALADARLTSSVYEFKVGNNATYTFGTNVGITLSFNASAVGADEIPGLFYYDESQHQWVNLGGTVSGSTITVAVNHFTKYAVFAVKKTNTTPVVAVTATTGALVLNDITGHWAEASINKLVALGAVSGYSDGSFMPDNNITRAEFATILVKAFKLAPQQAKIFADTVGHWASNSIATAVYYGIVSGYDGDTFKPDDSLTREQMALMVVKAAKLTMATDENTFTDSASISQWAANAVAAAIKNGIIKGYPDNTFNPQGSATRAEAATVIANAIK